MNKDFKKFIGFENWISKNLRRCSRKKGHRRFLYPKIFFKNLKKIFKTQEHFSFFALYCIWIERKIFQPGGNQIERNQAKHRKEIFGSRFRKYEKTRSCHRLQARPYGETHDFSGNQYTKVVSPQNEGIAKCSHYINWWIYSNCIVWWISEAAFEKK